MSKFSLPDGVEPLELFTATAEQTTLKPNSRVVCINRGNKVLTDQFDSKHIKVPPGYFKTEYGAALHLQKRQIVPGTRNLETGGFVSFIAILGSEDGRIAVDSEDMCQPFTDEELQRMGERIEGIDRGMLAGAARQVQAFRTSSAMAASATMGVSRGLGTQIGTGDQISEGAAAAAERVFEKPAESETRAAEAQYAAEVPAETGGKRRR